MRRVCAARGQSVGEYALMLSIAAVAIVAVQTYMKRGIQAQVKMIADGVLVSSDMLSLVGKTPEEAQILGIDTQDAGTGLGGTDTVSTRTVEQHADYTEQFINGIGEQNGTLSSTKTTDAKSQFVNRLEIPARFELRRRVFDELGGDLNGVPFKVDLPEPPPVQNPGPVPGEPPGPGPTPPPS